MYCEGAARQHHDGVDFHCPRTTSVFRSCANSQKESKKWSGGISPYDCDIQKRCTFFSVFFYASLFVGVILALVINQLAEEGIQEQVVIDSTSAVPFPAPFLSSLQRFHFTNPQINIRKHLYFLTSQTLLRFFMEPMLWSSRTALILL